MKLNALYAAVAVALIAGCNSDDDPVNQVPQITLSDSISGDEKAELVVTATATDSDGSIASYAWEVSDTGESVTLAGADSNSVTLTLPEVTEGGKFVALNLTVTDDDGATATASTQIDITQLTIPLTINGLVTDSPIANAKVSVKISGLDEAVNVTATADANGEYSIDLLLDDSQANAFISLVAQGVEQQANAGLTSLLGSAQALSDASGEDNTLEASENFAVRVTNLTTAQYALINQATEGQSVTTDEQLASLVTALDFNQVVTVATAIKVAIDKAGDNPALALPDGVTDTLQLVNNMEQLQSYVQQVQGSEAFAEAQQEMFDDPALVDSESEWTPDIYYAAANNAYGAVGNILRYSNDNTGRARGETFTWSLADGVLSNTFDQARVYEYSVQKEIDGVMTWVPTVHTITHNKLKRLHTGAHADTVLGTEYGTSSYPQHASLEDEPYQSSTMYTLVKSLQPFEHSGAGVFYAQFMHFDDPEDLGNNVLTTMEAFVLNADGTGKGTLMDFTFDWAVTDGKLLLTNKRSVGNDTPTDEVASFSLVNAHPLISSYAFEYSEDGVNPDYLSDSVGGGVLVTGEQPKFAASQVPGIYTFAGSNFAEENNYNWIELQENGHANTYSTYDNNGDGQLTQDEVFKAYGMWRINEQYELEVTRVYKDGVGYDESCRDGNVPGCRQRHLTSWKLLAQQGSDFAVHSQRYFYQQSGFLSFGWHRINWIQKQDSPPVDIDNLPAGQAAKPTQAAVMQQMYKQALPMHKSTH